MKKDMLSTFLADVRGGGDEKMRGAVVVKSQDSEPIDLAVTRSVCKNDKEENKNTP